MLNQTKPHQAFLQMYNEGLFLLYRGVLPPLIQRSVSLSLMFGIYEETRRKLIRDTDLSEGAIKTLAGMAAGSTEALLVPFERVQTLLTDNNYLKKFKNTIHAVKVIGKEYGIKEYFRGATPVIMKNGVSNSLFFTLRDEIRSRITNSNLVLSDAVNEFLCGSLTGMMLSFIFFPLNVVKIAMQRQLGVKFESMFQTFKRLHNERNNSIRNIYIGVYMNSLKACLSWGIINVSFEELKKFVHKV